MSASRRLVMLADSGNYHTRKWAGEFARRGWDVHVLSLHPGEVPGVEVHSLRGRLPGKVGYLTVLGQLRRHVSRLAPTLLHAHYATSYGLLGAWAAARPLITSVWGADVYNFPRASGLHRALLERNLRAATALTSTSHAMARETEQYAPGRQIHVIPFGVDLAGFRPGPAPDVLTIGCAKALEPKYGQRYLIEAVRMLRDRNPEREVRLLLAGKGSERASLEAWAQSLGVADRVHFLGSLPHAEIPAFLHQLSVFAMPSTEDSESFGVAAVEASASGLPVVATSVGGVSEVVLDGKTGLLVPRKDSVALAEALDALLTDASRRTAMGEAGRAWVAEAYDWQHNADTMEALYQTVI